MTYLSPRNDEGDLPTVAIQYLPREMVGREQVPPLLPRSGLPPRTRFAAEREILVRALDEGPSFRDLLSRLLKVIAFARRHLRLLVVCTFVAGAAGGASAFLLAPPSTAAFEVRLTPKTAVNPVQQFERATVEFFASAETSFKSPDLVRKTLKALGEKSPKPDAVRRARDGLLFESVGLRTYRGTYEDASPSRAIAFLVKHVDLYRETEVEKTLKVIEAEVDFLRGQLAQGEGEVRRIEGELMTFRQKHIDGLPEQAQEQFTSRLELRTRQTELASQLERATLELGLARRRVKSEDPTLGRRVESSHSYKTALAEVNGKLGEARASGFAKQHPEVKRLEKQAAELQRLSEETLLTQGTVVEQRTSPVLKAMRDRVAELEVERTAAAKELGRVSALLAGVDRAVRALPEVEARHAELTRAHTSTKAIVVKLFEQFKASELQVELERASAAARYEILMAPELVNRSIRKTAALRVALAALAGLTIALLVAAFVDIRRYVKRTM